MLDFLLPFIFLYQGVAYKGGVAFLILHFLLLGSLISTGSAIPDCRVVPIEVTGLEKKGERVSIHKYIAFYPHLLSIGSFGCRRHRHSIVWSSPMLLG